MLFVFKSVLIWQQWSKISEEEALLKLQKLQDLESQNVATVEVVNDNGDVEKLETKLEIKMMIL